MLSAQPVQPRRHTFPHRSAAAAVAALSLAPLARAADRVDYAKEVKPILRNHCWSCHGALQQRSGLRLDTAASIRKGGDHGPAIIARKPNQSLLIAKVTDSDAASRMPRDAEALKPAQIAILRAWIEQGASAPADEIPEPSPRDHWAFKRVERPPVPELRSSEFRVQSSKLPAPGAIDAFILASLAKANLPPVGEAAPEVLLRRVYLDLLGLPPTREELHAFLADTSPEAYERVVDRLLSDPRHGERWARHWMDVWRYSDWFGRRQVPDVWNSAPQIWRWRDWIVRSLNADHGYDRMVKAMLAADEIAPLDDEAAVATGYLVRNWYALNPNEWMRANVEHTGKAFLGLTFNCAHCHDHKYDPITQADYFGFRAFFEPLYVRQDRWPGEADPGPFQDYDYSKNRKVQRLGTVRVFDKDAAAKTWFYTGGDERNRLTNRPPVLPAMPEFLGGKSLRVASVSLPPTVSYPGAKPFIREAEVKRVDDALAAAKQTAATNKTALTEARLATAEAERASVLARLAADEAKQGAPSIAPQEASDTNTVARAASKAERTWKLAAAKEALLKAEADAANAKTAAADAKDDNAKADTKTALTKAETALTAAKKAVPDAEAALAKDSADYTAFSPVYPRESTGRRKALAEWMTSRDNPLTARVAANHIWTRHFHSPLVPTVDNFGRSGAAPSHPELLDWLAAELMDSGWSMKHLHRLIVTSAAYRRESAVVPGGRSSTSAQTVSSRGSHGAGGTAPSQAFGDTENKLLWRMNAGRMETEVLRDSVLHLAGDLDLKMGGQELENPDMPNSPRRSLYFACFPESGGSGEFTAMFDPPNPNECYRRTKSVVPQQALALTNSKLIHEQSAALAKRLGASAAASGGTDESGFITAAFEHLLARSPRAGEVEACSALLEKQSRSVEHEGANVARESLIRALLNHSDFVTVR
jgi:hypothetical protein